MKNFKIMKLAHFTKIFKSFIELVQLEMKNNFKKQKIGDFPKLSLAIIRNFLYLQTLFHTLYLLNYF
jgi:hypothetical protein